MDKKQIAAALKEMAVMMEISGANPFKIRAHENAARILEGLTDDLRDLVDRGELTGIKGIGKGMAEKITALVNEGTHPEYRELKSALPEGLLQMARIPGVGPKKVKALWDELGVTSVAELETAAREDRIAGLKGFGSKSQEKILQNINMMKKFQDRFLLREASAAAEMLRDALSKAPGVIRCEIAGSYRRRTETVKDIDIVVSAEDADRGGIMDHFTGLPAVASVTGKGDTKSGIVLGNGMNADLRIVSDDQFPYTLHHFTGSKEHNVAMRRRAIQQGLKVSEYGLFKGEENIPCKEEADIFRHLGLDYIPPELRENYGELEAAANGKLPELLEAGDIRGIIHTHTVWSDGRNTVEEMARACRERGYEYLVISDHSKAAAYANGLNEERIRRQHEEIETLNEKLNGFRILKSIECDILTDGSLDYDDDVLAGFDLVIVSVHSKLTMDEAEATERIIKAIRNPYVTILGHMTGRLLLARDGYPVDHKAVIDAAADLGVSIEINANPRRLDMDWRYCRYAIEKNVMISINPDAHWTDGFDDMAYGIGIARKGWLTKEQVLNTRSAEEVLAFARRRHP